MAPLPKPPEDDPRARAAAALAAVSPLATRWIERLLASHKPPLTVPQFLALRAVEREKVTTGELARRAGISGPAASQLLAGLAGEGLLVRAASPEDRRRQTLSLSAAGRCAFHSAEALLRRRLGELLSDLPRPESDTLARVLPEVEAALSGSPPPRRPPPPPLGGPANRARARRAPPRPPHE